MHLIITKFNISLFYYILYVTFEILIYLSYPLIIVFAYLPRANRHVLVIIITYLVMVSGLTSCSLLQTNSYSNVRLLYFTTTR